MWAVRKMGNYGDILAKVKDTETEYSTMIKSFKPAEAEEIWFNSYEENTYFRFVVKVSNPNNYTLRDVKTEWTALDVNGYIVGSFSHSQPDIPANGNVYYIGGAGSAHLSGIPASVKVSISSEGLLTNRVAPKIEVENIQVINNGYGMYTVSADCQSDSEIKSSQLDGEIIVKNANGDISAANFWDAEDLPDTINEKGKFKISESFFDLPDIPKNAEVCMYYSWD